MDHEAQRLLGEVNGKLDTVLTLLRDHIQQDDTRFENIGKTLESHAADINQAKGAKAAILIIAGGLATAVSVAVTAAGKLFH